MSSPDDRSAGDAPGVAHQRELPPRGPGRTVVAVMTAVLAAYLAIQAWLADFTALFTALGVLGVCAVLTAAFGVGWLYWLHTENRLCETVDRNRVSAGDWLNRLLPLTAFAVAALLALVSLPAAASPETDAPSTAPGTGEARAGAPDDATDVNGCSERVVERLVAFSHRRLEEDVGVRDSAVGLVTGGYVQQRFFAATEQIASVAVILSRPGKEGPFDPTRIGRVSLSLFRVDSDAGNTEEIPLEPLNTDAGPTTGGMVIDAGENHKQTVFRFCPVPVVPGERYAFRVTNMTPGVVLAISLSVQSSPNTSIDYIGVVDGQDRKQINYFQVAGYVCSLASC